MTLILNLCKLSIRILRKLRVRPHQRRPERKQTSHQSPRRTERPRPVETLWRIYIQESTSTGYSSALRFSPMQRATHGSHAKRPWSSYRVSSKLISDLSLQWVRGVSLSNVLLTFSTQGTSVKCLKPGSLTPIKRYKPWRSMSLHELQLA